MTGITERLRLRADPSQMLMSYPARPAPDMLCYEAAAKIEQLRAEIAALQAALRLLIEWHDDTGTVMLDVLIDVARAALGEKTDD